MQQWAVTLVLVLPHASICDAPPAFTTDLSLTLFHVAFLDVGTYICQLVVVFLRHYLLLLTSQFETMKIHQMWAESRWKSGPRRRR